MNGKALAKIEGLGQRAVVMPCRDYESVLGYFPEVEGFNVCSVDRVVPQAAILAPRHHVQTAGTHKPVADIGAPIARNRSFDEQYRPKGSQVLDAG